MAIYLRNFIFHTIVLLLLTLSLCYANTNSHDFSIEKANITFDQIALKLSIEDLKPINFEQAIETLTDLNEQAAACFRENSQKLESIDNQLKSLKTSNQFYIDRKDVTYLVDKKNTLIQKVSDCRLFKIRSEEAIKAYINTLHNLTTSRLLAKTNSFWYSIISFAEFKTSFREINFNQIVNVIIFQKWYLFLSLIILYLIYWRFIKWVLYLPVKHKQDDTLSKFELYKKNFYRRMNILGLLGLIGIFVYLSLQLSQSPKLIVDLTFELLIICGCLCLFWCAFIIKILIPYKIIYRILLGIFAIILLCIIALTSYGYHNLSVYLVMNIFLSALGFIGVIFIHKLIIYAISKIDGNQYLWQQKIKFYLGVKPHKQMPEVVILKVVATLLIAIFYLSFLVYLWGWKTAYPHQFISALSNGFELFQIKIDIFQIILAIVVFVVLCFASRFFSAAISKKYQKEDKDLQIAMASIIGYASFSIAILIGLLVSGVNFTGLAIIAGALSVGIGLGLQDIVNNFVSGIVLLLEKPIRPGDRIIVGDTEGFVKKVRIRSTQITTLAKSDVIVPNADLIKNQVTNYMFRDRYWRIACAVGVAYGSDIELVRSVLLSVANENPNIIHHEPDQPVVLFREFGDSSLNFELWCIIQDVNNKYKIQSELNFAIDDAFRNHNIVIAFPQRDVHLYQHQK
ncbi:mechanosensitive ion channel [Thiotrichales bacterium 19S3-7]|nr:mechanosensitive ion channel [Thiotrichales bacterium 19S3-7]MCF6802161.1 mechanosensitive ion channel [Thiotrichales bacterium 19S3-11]